MMQTAERTRFTEAEMATVRDTDLPDLLISLGYQVKRIGRYYTTQEMDSIRIKDRRTWFRYSEGIGGDANTFLPRVYNKRFPGGVGYLLTWQCRARGPPPVGPPRPATEKEGKGPLTPPPQQRGGGLPQDRGPLTPRPRRLAGPRRHRALSPPLPLQRGHQPVAVSEQLRGQRRHHRHGRALPAD